MCRFNKDDLVPYGAYIANLNTSYVSVQYIEAYIFDCIERFKYIICVGSIDSDFIIKEDKVGFKYIICVGSRYGFENDRIERILFKYIICVGSRQGMELKPTPL